MPALSNGTFSHKSIYENWGHKRTVYLFRFKSLDPRKQWIAISFSMFVMNNTLLAKLGYTFCLLCIDQTPTLYIGTSFQNQVHQSNHQEWKETKKFLNSWSTAFPSQVGWPLGVVLTREQEEEDAMQRAWSQSPWVMARLISQCHAHGVPSYCAQWDVYGRTVRGTRVSVCPRITDKSPWMSLVQSRQNIRSVGEGQDQNTKNTGYSKDPGGASQVKEGGRPNQGSSFCSSDQGPMR